jgi:hypothetical protein
MAALALGFLVLHHSARADEEKVDLKDLPKAVAAAVKARFPDAEMVGASKEKENGKTEYEVSVKTKDGKADVTLTSEGMITGIEKEIAVKDLPKAVADALAAKYPGANHQTAEEVIAVKDGKETLESYEVVLVTAEKKKLEVVVSPEGKVKKEEDKSKSKD